MGIISGKGCIVGGMALVFMAILGVRAFAADHAPHIDIYTDQSSPIALEKLKHLSLGGFTPASRPTNDMLRWLSRYGFRSLRLINVEWDNYAFVQDGKIQRVNWSQKLENELRICKELGLIPHVIVGQIAPHGLQIAGKGNERRGVRDWALYRAYLRAFMDHVTGKWGFKVVAWEVGNEMDNPNFNWVPDKKRKERVDPKGYEAYLALYRVIAEEIDRYRGRYHNVRFLVGGPGLTQNSTNYSLESGRNWLARFALDIADKNIPCDFFSMHFYGSSGSRDELVKRFRYLEKLGDRNGRKLPVIWITEWGTNAFYQRQNENFTTVAGAFSLDFIKTAASVGVDNTLFLAAVRVADGSTSGPALLNRDGSMSDAMKGLDLLNRLVGVRVPCETELPEISCVAAKSSDTIQLLVWRTTWSDSRMGNVKSRLLSFLDSDEIQIDVSIDRKIRQKISLKIGQYARYYYPLLSN